MVTAKDISAAAERIEPLTRLTPCRRSGWLGGRIGGEAWLKLEQLQVSGSFKIRGVANKVLSLPAWERRRRLFAASTGNHGAAVAWLAERLGLEVALFMPATASGAKVERLRSAAVDLELVGSDCVEAEARAADAARSAGGIWISPYNDLEVIAGQGTVALEVVQQFCELDDLLVPVGGGGLISGVACFVKTVAPEVRVIGCQPRNSCVMQRSVAAGRIVADDGVATVSDATAGGIEPGSLTFEICRRLVDEFLLVEEQEIVEAMGQMFEREGMVIEGGAALPVAALLGSPGRFSGRNVALIITGGMVDREVLERAGIVAEDRLGKGDRA